MLAINVVRLLAVIIFLPDEVTAFSIQSKSRCHNCINDHPYYSYSRLQITCFAEKKGGTARFTGVDESRGASSALDFVLSLIVSDIGSIILGLIGLTIVVGHRLVAMDNLVVDTMGQETRSDLLATFASGAVLLNGVSKLDVTSALAETVRLDGVQLEQIEVNEDISNEKELQWSLESLLVATPARTVVLLALDDHGRWKVSASAGVVPSDKSLRTVLSLPTAPILDRFRKDVSKETYLPTLQALPGKSEFTYLPVNTQGALLLPVRESPTNVLVLGSDTAKSFTPRDIAWCRVLAERISLFL